MRQCKNMFLRYRAGIIGVFILTVGSVIVATGQSAEQAGSSLGRAIYEAKCVQCHGKDGKGSGPAGAFLSPRPRDLTAGKYKFRSTESGSIPTDEDLLNTIRSGLHGTAMPDWKPFLNNDSLQALLVYVKSFSPRFQNETPKVVKPYVQVTSSAASIASGKNVYDKLQCASCHGSDGNGKNAIASDLQDDWGHGIKATNLTEPWTFRGGATQKDVYLRFRTGLDGSPMPSYIGSATDREMSDLANYVVSLGRKPVWEMNEAEINAFYAVLDADAKKNPVERGKYLVKSIGCEDCHSPIREDASMVEDLRLAGGQRWDLYPYDNVVSYNLTSDKETGLGNWTDDQLKTFLTKGIRRNGTRMIPYPMPWPAFAHMKESDLNAIIAYLRTLPPVYNKIPEPQSPGFFSYMWGKFKALILKEDIPIQIYAGNAGTAKENSISLNVVPSHQVSKEAKP